MPNFWDFSVWGWLNLFSILLIALLIANAVKKAIPLLRISLIPTSVIGGAILLGVAGIYRWICKDSLFDAAFFGTNGSANLEIITYHALALGFIASSLKTSEGKITKSRISEIFNTGVTTVSTYLLQGVVGMGITMILAHLIPTFFPAAGILLPFGYGQGTGQALNYGTIYQNDWGFSGGSSFGLAIAALGFLSAAIGGVIHLAILRRRGLISSRQIKARAIALDDIQKENEIPMYGSIDKITVQVAIVALSYFIAYLLMLLLGNLIPSMKSVIYGFNFLLGVVSATLIKNALKLMKKAHIVKKDYTNNFLMTRVSNFFFDLMVVAGIAAIRLEALEQYWHILLGLGLVGALITYYYNYFVAKKLFPDYTQEQFLTMFGMLTGTASTGVILLREIDPDFTTPAADNLVYQNFPAIVFGFPMMLIATLAPQKTMLSFILLFVLLVAMNIILFRSFLFRKRKK